jgi:hypothetical protein
MGTWLVFQTHAGERSQRGLLFDDGPEVQPDPDRAYRHNHRHENQGIQGDSPQANDIHRVLASSGVDPALVRTAVRVWALLAIDLDRAGA